MKFFNKRIPNDRFPSLIVHLYYLMAAMTFTYLYFHKFIQHANFYQKDSTGGLHAVANFEATKPIQYRILVPLIFKAFSKLQIIPDKQLFFLIELALAYLIILSFYFLLNRHFQSKAMNCWLAPIIIYPMIWNLIIMNGQFFYMDFALLLIMIVGFYLIVSERYNWLLLTFFIGMLNHTATSFLVISFLLFNYKNLFRLKTIFYAAIMTFLFFAVQIAIDAMLTASNTGAYMVYNLPRNISLFIFYPNHLLIRDFLFNFGSLHFFVLIFLISGTWKRFSKRYLYINLMLAPYFISLLIIFSLEEMRNYAAIIPNILILSLFYLSTFPNSFIKPIPRLLSPESK